MSGAQLGFDDHDFYPRPPRGGRHDVRFEQPSHRSISIHALREEGDSKRGRFYRFRHDFYPRPPRGGRPESLYRPTSTSLFLSTPSARRATWVGGRHRQRLRSFLSTPSARRATSSTLPAHRPRVISIHALREEGDDLVPVDALLPPDFYPRPPRGGRRLSVSTALPRRAISIHALREEGDVQNLM